MDIFIFSAGLEHQLKTVADNRDTEDFIAHASKMMSITQDLMHDLQQYTYNYTFQSPADEIRFFKEVKPVLLSQYYYYKKTFDLTLFDSFREPQAKTKHYESLLTELENFARKHHDFYVYCMTNQTSMDDCYFLRKKKIFSEFIDARFSTGYDNILSQLLANELIRKHVIKLMATTGDLMPTTTWTGNKTDAIELLFALHASGAINHGDIDIRKLLQRFEDFFNIELGNYYDFLKNIRTRKGGRSNFLDDLKTKFLRRLDKMDG